MSRRLRGVVLLVIGIATAGVIMWWLGAPWIAEKGRLLLQRELARTLDMPVRIGGLTVAMAPPTVTVEEIALGENGDVLRVQRVTSTLAAGASVREFRLVADVDVEQVRINPGRFPRGERQGPPGAVPLPFRLRRLRVSDGDVQIMEGAGALGVSFGAMTGTIEARPVTRRLSTVVRIDHLRVRRNNEALEIETVRLSAAETDGGWTISELRMNGDGLKVAGGGEPGPPIRHRLEAEVALPRLRILDEHFASATGRLRVAAAMSGDLMQPEGRITLTAIDALIAGRATGNVVAELGIHGRQIELVAGRLDGLGGLVTFDGAVTLSDAIPFRLNVAWQDVDVGRATGSTADATASGLLAQGRIGSSGTLSPVALDGRADGQLVVPHAQHVPVEWRASGRYESSGGRVELSAEQGPANRVRGDLTVAPDGGLKGTVDAELGDAGALRPWIRGVHPPPVRGVLAATAEVGGTVAAPRLSGSLRAERIEAFGVIVERVGGSFAVGPEAVRLQEAVIEVGGGRLRADGTLALAKDGENAWEISVQNVSTNVATTITKDLTGIALPLWSGRLSATVASRGPWSRVSTSGSVRVEGFHLWGEPFEWLSLEMQAGWPSWNGEIRLHHRRGEQLDAVLTGSGLKSLQASVRGTEWNLERLRGASSAGLKGVVTASAEVAGPLQQIEGRVAIEIADFQWREREVGRVALSAEGDSGSWQLEGAVGDGVAVHGALVANGRFPLAVQLEWQDVDVGPLVTRDADVQIVSSGTAALQVPLVALREAGGEIRIATVRIARGTREMSATQPIRIRGEHGQFSILSLSLAGKNVQLDASGSLGVAGDVDLRARASGDLEWLEAVSERVQSARGRATVAVDIRRSVSGHWDLAGDGSVEDAGVDLGLAFTGVHGRFTLNGSVIQIDELRGELEGGTFDVGGHVDLDAGPALTWSVSEVSPSLSENLENELSGSGSVAGRWDDFTVAGAIEVTQALWDRRIGLVDLVPWFRREVAPMGPTERTERTIRLDVQVTVPEIFVDNNVAEAELRADLRVGGTIEDVTLAGPIDVTSGEVVLQGRKFVVERGVIEFRPALRWNPSLDITADTVVDTPGGSYAVSVQVVGTTEDYRVLLSSDDTSLSQTDLASLVSLGKTSAQLQQAGAGVSVGDLVALAPRVYGDEIEQRVREVLPIDRMTVESAYSRTTGSFEPRLIIGKDLTDRLAALVSTTFGVENRRGAELDYRLTPRISLSGKWESEAEAQAGAFGGDVKFHATFHRAPRFSLLVPWRSWWDGELW